MMQPTRAQFPKFTKNSYNSISEKQTASQKKNKRAGDLNRYFSKEVQMGNRCGKRCSTLLIIREMQIKTKMRHHLITNRRFIIKKSKNNKCWRGYEEKGTLLHSWWECKLVQPLWRTAWRSLKIKNRTTL